MSFRNRQPQADRSWQSNSGGYRENYHQYQQQPYSGNGYYANWGYDQTGGNYGYNHYDYTQYPPPQSQVSSLKQRLHCVHTAQYMFFDCLGHTVLCTRPDLD